MQSLACRRTTQDAVEVTAPKDKSLGETIAESNAELLYLTRVMDVHTPRAIESGTFTFIKIPDVISPASTESSMPTLAEQFPQLKNMEAFETEALRILKLDSESLEQRSQLRSSLRPCLVWISHALVRKSSGNKVKPDF